MGDRPTNNIIIKQSNAYALAATSFHESGHTIVGFHNYWYISNVDILNPPHHNQGETTYIDYDVEFTNNNDLLQTLVLFDLQATSAGLSAEKLYYKDICGSDKFPMHLKIGSSDDIKYISKQIRKYKLAAPGQPTTALKTQLTKQANSILTEHWDAVKLVAHQLYKRKSLTFDELKYILTRKTNNKEFWKERFKKIAIIHAATPPDEQTVRKLIK